MSHRVAIVGGGLSGLTTAKTLIAAGFYCTIFECSSFIGGMFNPSLNPFWPSFKTNLFKYSCAFSDFPWDRDTPFFISQTDVFEYLKNYSIKNIPETCFKFNCKVRNVAELHGGGFEVDWIESNGWKCTDEFTHVVITTGSFSVPHIPRILKSRLSHFKGKLIHSSEYRFPDTYTDQSVAVIGNAFSSSEICSDIAEVASKVTNVIPRHAYVVPHFIPSELDHPSTPFLPLDSIFYVRKSNVDDVNNIPPEVMFRNEQDRDIRHRYFDKLVGGSQGDVLRKYRTEDTLKVLPFVGISDNYASLVRAGKIEVLKGHVSGFKESSVLIDNTANSDEQDNLLETTSTELDNIDNIILCTGFKPNFDYLSEKLLSEMDYNPEELFLPVILYDRIFHPKNPNLAFVGMWRALFFGAAELQARNVAARFANNSESPPVPTPEEVEANLSVIRSIRDQRPRQQFPFTEYIGMMDNLAAKVGCIPAEDFRRAGTVVIPAHYQPDYSLAKAQNDELQQRLSELKQNTSGGIIERFVFQSLLGEWKLTKQVINHLDKSTTGTVEGRATFSRGKGRGNSDSTALSDLTYHEEGRFVTNSGIRMEVSKVYIYAFNPELEAIQVFFPVISQGATQPEHPERDYLFVSLKCRPSEKGWTTEDHHACRLDDHKASYTFSFNGSFLNVIEIRFRVIGPETNYETISTLSRP